MTRPSGAPACCASNRLRELFEAVTTLSAGVEAHGDRLAILTNGGGAGVLATDALEASGGRLAALSAATMAKLDALLPKAWSRANPVDILGDATGERYGAALDQLLADPERDAILVMNCPTAVADSLDAAKAVVERMPPVNRVPVLTCWLGETAAAKSRRLFAAKGLPTYETPDEAVSAFMHLVRYRRNQDLLLETPRDRSPAAGGRPRARPRRDRQGARRRPLDPDRAGGQDGARGLLHSDGQDGGRRRPRRGRPHREPHRLSRRAENPGAADHPQVGRRRRPPRSPLRRGGRGHRPRDAGDGARRTCPAPRSTASPSRRWCIARVPRSFSSASARTPPSARSSSSARAARRPR